MEARSGAGRRWGGGWARLAGALACLLLLAEAPRAEEPGRAERWRERVDLRGFFRSRVYLRAPDLEHRVEVSSWRSELSLEMDLRLLQGERSRLGLVGVLRPVWDAVYEIQPDTWGKRVREGAEVGGELEVVHAEVASAFSGRPSPAVEIDDVGFFGSVTAPVLPRSSRQDAIGGNATGLTFAGLRDHLRPRRNAGLPPDQGLAASLALASQPLATPLNFHRGALGDRDSLERGSADLNRRQDELAFDCFDGAHPWCFVRELYLEGSYRSTFFRLGRQQIVWGKTDAFRLQDRVNPIDLGTHNIFPDLEERRIPLLALDVIHGFGDLGPFRDVSLELAWVFDRFLPDQLGQCGEPYAFTAACGARGDARGHQLLNVGLAAVDEVPWRLENTEPGLRLDFRLPRPSLGLSLSAFYTFQDQPVARFRSHDSASRPNPAALLFLQGTLSSDPVLPVARLVEIYSGNLGGGTVWTEGFDPYDHTPGGGVAEANALLLQAWNGVLNVNTPESLHPGCATLTGAERIDCAARFAILALPWSGSEAVLEYPRLWALGASLDYEVPGIDTVLRVELASDLDRHVQDTTQRDGVSRSPVFLAAVGLDRATFLPFLSPSRTSFVSLQTFVEHIVDYRDRGRRGGMVPDETSVVSTAFVESYWRNDTVALATFAAVDWGAGAVAAGPSLRWTVRDAVTLEAGVNLLWGRSREHDLRNLCADATLDCLDDPTTWQDGNWQTLNTAFAREAEHPWWSQQSFADKFMRRRDEFWMGVTYRF